ncbi:hypothetical protein N5B55_04725 [Ralstonia pickettii]|uniref:exodeoxyribonuclease X C-terminal domain-containing protein n=1 Tax=Ralstonia pickettii TaxID=329 RepID=UPI00271492B7|nr:hypothetical protein [Ralstonia pickettii]WKZ86257.1 hypothetical protein N5B55_04725 [Ralstonia pickettii]
MSDGNTLDDVLHFGKHKGSTIRNVLQVEPTYLAWLRDKTAEEKAQCFFDQEANDQIDNALRNMKGRRGSNRQRIWSDNPPPQIADRLKAQAAAQEAARTREEEERAALAAQAAIEAAQARDMAYAHEWGAW